MAYQHVLFAADFSEDALRVGERIAIAGLPTEHALAAVLAGASLRARRVIHRFDATTGFTTRVEL